MGASRPTGGTPMQVSIGLSVPPFMEQNFEHPLLTQSNQKEAEGNCEFPPAQLFVATCMQPDGVKIFDIGFCSNWRAPICLD